MDLFKFKNMNKKNKKHIKFEESEESEVEINKNESFFNENTIDQEDLTLNFDRAVKKDLYKGKKGRMLFELQQKSKGDIRFSFGKNFKNDVDIDKVSKSTKYTTDAFDEVQDTTAKKKRRIREN